MKTTKHDYYLYDYPADRCRTERFLKDPIELPGYRPEFLGTPQSNDLHIDSPRFKDMSFKDQMRVIAANPDFDLPSIELKDLERSPLLNFGEGFESRQPSSREEWLRQESVVIPPGVGPEDIDWSTAPDAGYQSPKYGAGKAPESAPMSQEEMRVLLCHVIPAELIPFVLDNMVFDYSSDNDPDAPVATVQVKSRAGKDKIHLVFNKSAFITRGAPRSLQETAFEKANAIPFHKGKADTTITSFQDPSKIALIVSRVLGMTLPPPENWQDKVPPGFKLLQDDTKREAQRRGGRAVIEIEDEVGMENATFAEARQRQWEDFVSLAITAPALAKQTSGLTYAYFEQAASQMLDINLSDEAVERLKLKGKIAIKNFQMVDLRSQADKDRAKADAGTAGPGGYWFDKIFTGANKALKKLNLFGWKLRIVYELPEDPARMATLGDDAAEVKKYLENYRQEDREKIFGRVMRQARQDNPEDRAKARRLILASCESEDWHEWREIAYLYMFSKKFRDSKGMMIDKSDFLDLRMFHNTSSQRGKRFGSDMMPYSAVMAPDPDDVTGRQIFQFKRKSKEQYYASVRAKLEEKSEREVQGVARSTFDTYELSEGGRVKPEDLHKIYSATPEGMDTTYGRLDKLLGPVLARTIVNNFLEPLGVERIPPDSIYSLERLRRIALDPKGKGLNGEHMPGPAKTLIGHFGARLDRPPTKEIGAWLEGTHHLSSSTPADQVTALINQGESLKGQLLAQIISVASMPVGGVEGGQPLLSRPMRDKMIKGLRSGFHNYRDIYQYVTANPPEFKAPPDTPPDVLLTLRERYDERLRQERSNLLFVLHSLAHDGTGENSLALYGEIAERQRAILPESLNTISNAASTVAPELVITTDPGEPDQTRPENELDKNAREAQKAQRAADLADLAKAGLIDKTEMTTRLSAKRAEIEALVRNEVLNDEYGKPKTLNDEQKAQAELTIAAQVKDRAKNELPNEEARYLAEAFSQASIGNKELYIDERVANALSGNNSLDAYLKKAGVDDDYEAVYQNWESGPGRIFRLPAFAKVRQKLIQAVHDMNSTFSFNSGLASLSRVTQDLDRTLAFTRAERTPVKVEKKKAKPDDDSD